MRYQSRSLSRPTVLLGLLLLVFVVAGCAADSSDAESSDTTASTVVESMETTSTTAVPTDEDHADDEQGHDHEDEGHDHDEEGDDHEEVAPTGSAADVVELDEARRLLVVAAHDQAVVDLIDIADGSTESIELASVASVGSAVTESGRFLLAGHEDAVTVVDTGVWSEGHGDHSHHYSSSPVVVGRVEGPMPTHLISHDGLNALYFDGTGSALVLTERSLEDGDVTATAEVPTSEPHHGFAVPTHGAYFVTVPTDDMEGLPNVVGISDTDGVVQAQFDCPVTHGEASLADGAASACSDGIVLVTEETGTWTSTYLPYPEVDDEDPFGFGPARAWLLRTAPDQSLLAAPHGSRHLVIADPDNETIQSFDLGQSIATFGVIFDDDGHLIVLTLDGFIHLVDPGDGSIDASLEVFAPFQEGDTEQPWRQVAATGDHVYVTDPANNQVIEISVGDNLTVERTMDLDFAPGFLAIANG